MAADICTKYIFNRDTVRKCRQYMSEILHCTEDSKQIFPEMKLSSLVPNFFIHLPGSDLYISKSVLFGISFTLKGKKILTTRIIVSTYVRSGFQIRNLYVSYLCYCQKRDSNKTFILNSHQPFICSVPK